MNDNNIIVQKSYAFALKIINLAKKLDEQKSICPIFSNYQKRYKYWRKYY